MAIEIERKFLLANDRWREHVTRTDHLTDGLVARSESGKLRIRLCGCKAWLTLKGPRRGISRLEFEYEIPYADGLVILQSLCTGPTIEKVRHTVPFGGQTWAIDIHLGILTGTDFAELELEHADEQFPLPDWIGREVTTSRVCARKPCSHAALPRRLPLPICGNSDARRSARDALPQNRLRCSCACPATRCVDDFIRWLDTADQPNCQWQERVDLEPH